MVSREDYLEGDLLLSLYLPISEATLAAETEVKSFHKHAQIRGPGTASWSARGRREARVEVALGPEPGRPRRLRKAAAPASCRDAPEEPPGGQVAALPLGRAVRERRGGLGDREGRPPPPFPEPGPAPPLIFHSNRKT